MSKSLQREPLQFGRYDLAAFAAFTMYSVCSLAVPLMIVDIGKSLNFPLDDGGMAAGGVLHMVRSIFMVISLLACGFVAGKVGKRCSLGISITFFGIGIFLCSLTREYWMLLPCLMLAGLGEGYCEGILTPFVQDLHPSAPERYVNIGHSFWSVGIFLSVLLVGGCLSLGVDWRIVLGTAGVLTGLVSVLFLWKENPVKKYPEQKKTISGRDIWQDSKVIFREKGFWLCCLAMFFGAGAEFGLTFWAAAYINLTFHTSVFVAGVGTGVIALGMFLGRALLGYFAKPERLRHILLGTGLGTIPVVILLAFLNEFALPEWALFTVLFLLLFVAGFGIASYWPTTQVYGVSSLSHCNSTLLYVYYSTLGVPGCGVLSWLMGVVGDVYGLTGALMVIPVCLLIFCAVIYYECYFRAGRIAGQRTGN